MNILQIGITVFIFIEVLNIIILYFYPTSKRGNGIGVFNSYHNIKEENKDFVQYLIYWVAGTKLIFVMIGIVVIIFGNYETQLGTVVAFILSILTFYWKLYPIIKRLDSNDMISPKGYSKGLSRIIFAMISGFVVILILSIIS